MIASLHRHISFVALLLSLVAAYPATALPQSNTPSITPPSFIGNNITLTLPEERFQVRPVYWGPRLRSTACLFIGIDIMATLALRDFYEDMTETIFEIEDEPGVVITVLPKNWHLRGEMQRRFAVWGLYVAVFDMTTRSKYFCSTFHLLWDDEEVGTLGFSKGVLRHSGLPASPVNIASPQDQGLLSLNSSIPLKTTSIRSLINTTNPTFTLTTKPILSINVDLKNIMLPINNVFIGVLGALTDLASFTYKDVRVDRYNYNQAPVPAFLAFTTFGFRPLVQPFFMTYRHIIETLAQLTHIMFDNRKFSEADIELRLDGVEVGSGCLRRRPIDPRLEKEEGGQAEEGRRGDVESA